MVQAQDSDGLTGLDKRITDGRVLVQRFERGLATPYEQSLRGKVLAFHVNKAPTLVTSSPLFRPRTSVVDTFKTPLWDLSLVGTDADPWRRGSPPGGPSSTLTLRRVVRVIGTEIGGGPLVYEDPAKYVNQQNITFVVPSTLAPGPAILEVELCDCDLCELEPGTGRCATWQIPVYYQPTAPGSPAP